MSISIFGVRHHGPGCARSLHAALQKLEPDIILVEGPPDAQEVLPLILREEMQPPVALLIYAPENPRSAVYYPFTFFSPEWQALQYALQKKVPARFMDLPQAYQLGDEEPAAKTQPVDEQPESANPPVSDPNPQAEEEPDQNKLPEDDPLAMLAIAAGYTDHELWWERQIEQRRDIADLFEGILEAMTALRADITPKNPREAQREAYMRQTIRAAQKEGFQRIAVVCGAWHSPVLVDPAAFNAKADATLISKLKRTKVEATWIPWTNSRLAYRSGYGAGVTSPGWYEHLWLQPNHVTVRWIAKAAHLLRGQDLDASSASIIEAVRLGDALAAMRELPMPGMAELHESIETVLCHGRSEPMQLIRDQLEIGERLGEVPSETPAVPLVRDLEARQRRLRLKPTTAIEKLELDLRKDGDRERSQLLHQLRLLNVKWGEIQRLRGNKRGTFHEHWRLQWEVEFIVALIEANVWGNTVESAASGFVRDTASKLTELPALTELLDDTILAALPEAIDYLLECIQTCAAVSADTRHLMDALPPLARIARYGSVRQTDTRLIGQIINSLLERVLIGLPGACASLDDDAALVMAESIDHVQESINILDHEEQRQEWLQLLHRLSEQESIHGLIRGRCCRLLLEQHALTPDELQRLARLALSSAVPSSEAAAWAEGVLRGSGMLLLHQDGLWLALDQWLNDLNPDEFTAQLPLMRRAFSGFQQPERRAMGEKVKLLHSGGQGQRTSRSGEGELAIDEERAKLVLPVLAQILEVNFNG